MRCHKAALRVEAGGQVFVSYRRGDLAEVGRLVDALRVEVPDNISLFFDGQLDAAENWSVRLHGELSRSHAVLAMIGRSWLGGFKRRTGTDVMLRELEWALNQQRPILPVLLDAAKMPPSTALPTTIRPMMQIQAARIRASAFSSDVAELARRVPTLIAQIGDTYSAALLDSPRSPPGPPWKYNGLWQTVVHDSRGGKVTLEFAIRDGTIEVTGRFKGARGGWKRFTGDYYVQARGPQKEASLSALRLIGFVDDHGPIDLTIPLVEKRGDTYVGVSPEGLTIASRQLEKGW